jgi:cytochrome c
MNVRNAAKRQRWRTMFRLAAAAAALSVLSAASASASGDVAKGEKVFAKCKICHDAASTQNKIGPGLKGVFGRKAGTLAGYTYSNAMKSSGIVWNEDKLKAFVANPKTLVPATKMAFVGLKKHDEIEDLIAYLKTATK